MITTQFTKQAGDLAWENDPEVIEYIAFMKKRAPNDNSDFIALSGYVIAQGIAQAVKECGDDLTRENFLMQVTSMKGKRFKMMLWDRAEHDAGRLHAVRIPADREVRGKVLEIAGRHGNVGEREVD